MEKDLIKSQSFNRRQFLEGAAKAAVIAPFVKPTDFFTKQDSQKDNVTLRSPANSVDAPRNSTVENEHTDNNINTETALVVAPIFGLAIGAVASGKVEFGAKTILPVSVAESYRMWQLKKSDKHAYDHEQKELIMSIGLVPVLAAVAETADSTRVYTDSLFETERLSEDEAEALALDETHDARHKVENLTGKSAEECREYLNVHKEEVTRLAAANAALVTIISPLATTYVGASSAESSFAPMTRALTKAYYADSVLKSKENSEAIDHESTLKNSLEKAKKAMNGQLGYCNLSLAMAANTSGMAGIGDPPLIYSGILNRSPFNHALVSAEGVAISEAASIAANNLWLKSLNLGMENSFYNKEFVDYHAKTGKALTSLIVDGEVRQGFLWGYAGQSKEFTKILEVLGKSEAVSDANIDQLREQLRSISHPVLELDISEYIPRKQRGLINEFRKKRDALASTVTRNKKDIREAHTDDEYNFEEALEELFSSETSDQAYLKSKEIDENKRKDNIAGLAKILLSIVRNGQDPETKSDLEELTKSVNAKGSLPLKLKLEKMLTDDSFLTTDELKGLPHLFGAMGAGEVQQAVAHALEHYRGSLRDHPHDELLGHASSEVVAALMTQLPAVPSLVHLTKEYLPKAVESKTGEKLPASTVNKKVAAVLVATAAISSTADNVAAYLFGKAVLEEIFKDEYGEKLSYEHKWYANDAALLSAIVGGSLSKVGNGANFLISQVDPEINGDQINVAKKKVGLAKSYTNPYSIVQTGAVLTALMAHKKAIDAGLPNLYSIKK